MLESLASAIGSGLGTTLLYVIFLEVTDREINQWVAAGLFTAGTVAGLTAPAITSMA